MRQGPNWTAEKVAQLTELRAEGHAMAEIGRRMKLSKNAVVSKANRLFLDARPSPIKKLEPELRERAVALLQSGRGPLEVAATTGMKVKTIRSIRRSLDLPRLIQARPLGRKPTTTADDEARVWQFRENGLGYGAISKRTGLTEDIVRRVLGRDRRLVTWAAPARPTAPVIRLQTPSRPAISVAVPPPLPASIPRAGSCLWPMWGHHERPRFLADGGPDLCGAARCRGSYCDFHRRIAYTQVREQAA